MRASKSKSFSLFEQEIPKEQVFSSHSTVQKRQGGSNLPIITLSVILKKLLQILEKLFVAAKYQFFKRTNISLSAKQLPWFKIAIVALAAFIVFKKDLSFSVNMADPSAKISDDERGQNSQHTSFAAGSIAPPVSFETKKINPFADSPEDDEKAKKIKAYIRRFQKIAVTEKEKFGIPASVKMAQAIIESNSGNSKLATSNNNHFGIKCFSKKCKKGHCSNFGDDHHKDFFRSYESAWESWRAHSEMIIGGRYKNLVSHEMDYRAWAKDLKKLGYATDNNYTDKLIATIETYQLYLLDS